jgi:hypothetical protein
MLSGIEFGFSSARKMFLDDEYKYFGKATDNKKKLVCHYSVERRFPFFKTETMAAYVQTVVIIIIIIIIITIIIVII